MAECNCPPMHDVFRHGVGTKPPCPVHGEREAELLRGVKLLPRMDTAGMTFNTIDLGATDNKQQTGEGR